MNTKTPQLDRLMSLATLHVNMMNTKSNSYCTNTNGRAIFKGNSPLRYSMDLGHNSWYKSVSVSRPNGLSRLSKGAPTRLPIRICIRFPVFPLLESSLIWIFYFVDLNKNRHRSDVLIFIQAPPFGVKTSQTDKQEDSRIKT